MQVQYEPKSKKLQERKSAVVESEIKRLYDKHGSVSPQLLVEAGRDPDSPLHKYFEWNNDRAAEKFRLGQAYSMIQASKFVAYLVENGNKTPEVKQGVAVRKLLPTLERGSFKMRNEVLEETESRQLLIERKLAVLRSWCKSTVDIEELRHVRELIEGELVVV